MMNMSETAKRMRAESLLKQYNEYGYAKQIEIALEIVVEFLNNCIEISQAGIEPDTTVQGLFDFVSINGLDQINATIFNRWFDGLTEEEQREYYLDAEADKWVD